MADRRGGNGAGAGGAAPSEDFLRDHEFRAAKIPRARALRQTPARVEARRASALDRAGIDLADRCGLYDRSAGAESETRLVVGNCRRVLPGLDGWILCLLGARRHRRARIGLRLNGPSDYSTARARGI